MNSLEVAVDISPTWFGMISEAINKKNSSSSIVVSFLLTKKGQNSYSHSTGHRFATRRFASTYTELKGGLITEDRELLLRTSHSPHLSGNISFNPLVSKQTAFRFNNRNQNCLILKW